MRLFIYLNVYKLGIKEIYIFPVILNHIFLFRFKNPTLRCYQTHRFLINVSELILLYSEEFAHWTEKPCQVKTKLLFPINRTYSR